MLTYFLWIREVEIDVAIMASLVRQRNVNCLNFFICEKKKEFCSTYSYSDIYFLKRNAFLIDILSLLYVYSTECVITEIKIALTKYSTYK